MNSRKLLIIILFLFVVSILSSCSNVSYLNQRAENGIVDISKAMIDQEVIKLDGQWEFYWNQLLEPEDLKGKNYETDYIEVPSSWNKYRVDGKELSGEGYATYRLIFIADGNERLGIKVPRIFTSYKLYVNGEQIAVGGIVGGNRELTTPQYIKQVALFESLQGENEILIQVSNFYHRSGGLLESLTLGNQNKMLDLQYKNIAYELFLFGSLMVMGIYHLVLFLYRKKNKAPLYFGLFCIFVGIRTLLVGERFFLYLFPHFSWEVAHKIQTMTFYFGVPILIMFFLSVYPKYFHLRVVRVIQFVGIIFGILVLLTPARIFTLFNPIYQIFTLCVVVYLIVVFIRMAILREKHILMLIVGGVVIILTSLNDILFLSVWLNDYSMPFLRAIIRTGNLSSFGQLIFVFTNSLVLAKRFSYSLEQEEVVTAKLIETNKNLDKLVLERTQALEESNKKVIMQKLELEKVNKDLKELTVKDPLTGLWNRRHYDEIVQKEWKHCLRYKKTISLMMIDIDYFKAFNDFYGHKAGDDCLIKIAQTIESLFKRSSDIVVRYGGEEFVAIMVELRKEEAIEMANTVCKTVENLNIPHETSPMSSYVTVSIGVTTIIPEINSSQLDLFLKADQALYRAKIAGRNQVSYI